MIETIIVPRTPKTKSRHYPKYVQQIDCDLIVLAQRRVGTKGKEFSGTVIRPGTKSTWDVGDYSNEFVVDFFTDVEGTIESKNGPAS